ncbi:alpha/beta hydrolase fold domain-containing protein [Acuticoccus sp. MNP-M23]|uniref:alpha/beta hydrolase fold domain-containing protein n=1 Tax=Acuticoccus sp. MNP-M23 TaxID=3072793 RepID=UPI0028153DB1|nr:alpha/beta hydrolase fold domain-containing protein [Acuticoccus sp. MNP-M23]WMS44780.1 alpha/beta hydrolase fold domain-containing protein [Acuticoccus sp. MNP-M23]
MNSIDDVVASIKAHKPQGRPAEMRAAFAALVGPQPAAEDVAIGPAGGLAVGSGPTLLWFHGGGFVFGAPETHVALARAIAAAGVRVVLPRYRLAPEHPWPAMLDDALAAIDAVPGPVMIGGDSAGGQLALCAARRRTVRGVAVLSPNTDRTGASRTRKPLSARDLMNDDAGDAALAREAFGDRPGDDPDVSPWRSDLSGIAALHIEVGTEEVLLGDSLLLAEAAVLAGVPTALHMTPGLFHLAALWPDAVPGAAAQLARLGAFARDAAG